ncbi:hypothetical protein LNQ52_29245 [Klebsiella pneumoniae subsp. pneumoniae]|nr:hypothetical protein [Klebsiella pneumoniae subsp. pneumoniae]
MAWLDLRFLFWLAPIVVSLILSPFVSAISSRATVGLRTKRWKLFLIPEEYSPPQVLKDTDAYLTMNRQRSLDDGTLCTRCLTRRLTPSPPQWPLRARHRQGHILGDRPRAPCRAGAELKRRIS